MARTFLTVTQDEIDERVAQTIRSREFELAAYDFEKESHEAAIAALGNIEWTDATRPYRGMPRDAMVAKALADGLSSAQIQAISDLNSLESHRMNLEAVKIETKKSERHYDKAKIALPAGARRTAAIAKVKDAEAAALVERTPKV